MRPDESTNHEPTVFLVDDDPAVLRSLAVLVRVVFPRVEAFGSAREFLEAYDPDRPGCLVLDVAMPEINGLQLQQRLVDQGIDLPVVFLTGYASVPMAVGAMQAGAVDFLEKPFRDQQLWESVRKALAYDSENRRQRARRRSVRQRLNQLSEGEQAVLELILDGKYNKEIAAKLNVSIRTVEDRRARLMKKMQARSLAELVQLAVTH